MRVSGFARTATKQFFFCHRFSVLGGMSFVVAAAGAATVLQTHGGLLVTSSQENFILRTRQRSWLASPR
jgi:hypothetical protein